MRSRLADTLGQAAALPLTVLSPPAEMKDDTAFLAANGVKILMVGNPAYSMAVKAIHDCFKHLKDGGALEDLTDQRASPALLQRVIRTEEFVQWQQTFLRA